MKLLPYSGKLSREKTFSVKFWGHGILGVGRQANMFELVKITVMSLLKYFQLSNSTLPKADGPLSQVMLLSSITAPNKEVKQVLDQSNKSWEETEV